MRVPLSWLREFTPVEGTAEEIARALSFLGLVVEAAEVHGPPLNGIVAARVLATRAHPAADLIQLVDVDTGDGEALQICCGAFNMKAGDLVALASLGTVMPDGMEIGRRKMRGQWSNGMLCSAAELGLGDVAGEKEIYLLAPSAQVGRPVADALGIGPDIVFDIEVGPNRPDCFSVAGVARDLAAGLRLPFALPALPHVVDPLVGAADVAIDPGAADLCPRFTGTVIEDVGAASVPALVRHRLALAGMRAISAVVDVSNYVMLELGQPNHPYDLALVGGGGLVARRAHPGEPLVTLDGVARTLTPEDLVIADARGVAMGVAGIMGGTAAEIGPATSTVLLEVANFASLPIAATGKRLGVHSEARTRFERGVDIELAERATDRFVELLGPAVRRGPTTDVGRGLEPWPPVKLRPARANALLGTDLTAEQCTGLLALLGFESQRDGEGTYAVSAPSWRPDCTREADLVEEIARIHGYENIPRRLPARPAAAKSLSAYQRGRRRVREVLAGTGASEAWTSSFLSAADLRAVGLGNAYALELENPLDQSQGLLRPSVLPGLLRAVRFNLERQAGALALFELGSVFRRAGGPPDAAAAAATAGAALEGVEEWEQLGLVAVGDQAGAGWAVRAFEVLSRGLRLDGVRVEALAPAHLAGTGAVANVGALHPSRVAAVVAGELCIGLVGELAPEVAGGYDISSRAGVLVADLRPLLGAVAGSPAAVAMSRYPATDLDLAFVVDESVAAGELGRTLARAGGELVSGVGLFDVWRGAALGAGRRSLAFRLRLRAPDRTLTEGDVAGVRALLEAAAATAHGAALRQATSAAGEPTGP